MYRNLVYEKVAFQITWRERKDYSINGIETLKKT